MSQVHPLDGTRERLKRAEENIQNLNREITAFLAPVPIITLDVKGGNPIITDEDRYAWDKLTEFIKIQKVAPRFSVLTGEIIHHFRSAFDHLAWQLSSPVLQANSPTQIEFPVFRKAPELCGIAKNKICRYCRKVEGISSPSALARINSLQPYNRANPTRDPLWLIHDMDRIDKHRELVLAVYTMNLNIAGEATAFGIGRQMPWEIKPRDVHLLPGAEMKMKVKMSSQITFREFSGRDDESIIPMLQNLLRFTNDAIESFAVEFA